MRVIFKYELEMRFSPQTLELPVEATILSVGMQNNTVCIWVLFNTEFPGVENRSFRIVGTDHENVLSRSDKFLGTAQNNQYVWHIFEL